MKPETKSWLLRLSSLLIFLQSLWAVWLFTSMVLPPGNTFWTLFIAPGIYLVEIILLGGFTALLPWLKLKQTPTWLWIIAGVYAALALSDLWTVGYYLSPALILTIINAAFLSPQRDQFTWRNFLIFTGSGI
ncbi:MAG: hypothetical protein ABFS17_08675, partial [Chloroflexota bacterium]